MNPLSDTFDDFVDDLLSYDVNLLKGELDFLLMQHLFNSIDLKLIDNAKSSFDTFLGNQINNRKPTHLDEVNQEAFDLLTYKKFLSFLKFQEMTEKYDT